MHEWARRATNGAGAGCSTCKQSCCPAARGPKERRWCMWCTPRAVPEPCRQPHLRDAAGGQRARLKAAEQRLQGPPKRALHDAPRLASRGRRRREMKRREGVHAVGATRRRVERGTGSAQPQSAVPMPRHVPSSPRQSVTTPPGPTSAIECVGARSCSSDITWQNSCSVGGERARLLCGWCAAQPALCCKTPGPAARQTACSSTAIPLGPPLETRPRVWSSTVPT